MSFEDLLVAKVVRTVFVLLLCNSIAGNSSKHRKLSDGLFIKNVTQADAGEYMCRAMRITPTFSDSDQITILLRIQRKCAMLNNIFIFSSLQFLVSINEKKKDFDYLTTPRSIVLDSNKSMSQELAAFIRVMRFCLARTMSSDAIRL